MLEATRDLRVGDHKERIIWQDGLIKSTTALPLLFEYLKKTYNIDYLMTARLNQDALENIFSQIR